MKIKVNAATWKTAVTKANKLVGKVSGNPNESCIQINIKEDNNYLYVVEAGVHNTKINLTNIEILEEGNCYLQADSLSKMTGSLFTKELIVETKNNKLVYEVEGLGAIYEPIFHNQSPFHGMVFAKEDYYLVAEGETTFSKLLKNNIKPLIDNKDDINKGLQVVLNKDKSVISGKISLAGGLVYTFESEANCSFTLKTELFKSMSFILEDLSTFKLEKGNSTIKLSSSKGETILSCTNAKDSEVTNLVKSFTSKEDSVALIKAEELSNVVRWQSYNAEDGNCISIHSEEDKLLIKGDKTEEASNLEYNESSPFNPIKLTADGFTKAVATLPKDSVVTLKTTLTDIIGRDPIKNMLVIYESDDYTSTAYLSEPMLLS
jgi:hypothetical protein